MQLGMFAVYDSKMQRYLTPFTAPNQDIAIRIMIDTLRDPQTTLRAHPLDYHLYCIGSFDDENGDLKGQPVQALGCVVQWIEQKPVGLPIEEPNIGKRLIEEPGVIPLTEERN